MHADQPNLSDASGARDVLLVLGAFTVGQAMQVNNGLFHPVAIAWLAAGVLSLVLAMLQPRHWSIAAVGRVRVVAVLIACITVQWVELLVWDMRWGTRSVAMIGCMVLMAAAVGVAVGWRRGKWLAVGALVAGHFAAGAISIQHMPRPSIDVWHFQEGSAAALLHGHNPYEVRFRDIYGPDAGFYAPDMVVDGWLTYSQPYPPLNVLATLPGRLAGDIRWSHLVALELAAVLMVAAASARRVAILAAALLLLNPRSLFVIEAAWTEPTVLLMLAAVMFCACRRRQWLWLAFGLLLAIKQYMILALPLAFLLLPAPLRWGEFARLMGRAVVLAALITLPFFLWEPHAFFRSVVLWQLHQPFRPDAISFVALMHQVFGVFPGLWLCGVMTLGMAWLACRVAPRSAVGFAIAMAAVLLMFFATNKQAFANYYFLVVGAICCAIAAGVSDTRQRLDSAPAVASEHLFARPRRPGDVG